MSDINAKIRARLELSGPQIWAPLTEALNKAGLPPHQYFGAAKLGAECENRRLSDLAPILAQLAEALERIKIKTEDEIGTTLGKWRQVDIDIATEALSSLEAWLGKQE